MAKIKALASPDERQLKSTQRMPGAIICKTVVNSKRVVNVSQLWQPRNRDSRRDPAQIIEYCPRLVSSCHERRDRPCQPHPCDRPGRGVRRHRRSRLVDHGGRRQRQGTRWQGIQQSCTSNPTETMRGLRSAHNRICHEVEVVDFGRQAAWSGTWSGSRCTARHPANRRARNRAPSRRSAWRSARGVLRNSAPGSGYSARRYGQQPHGGGWLIFLRPGRSLRCPWVDVTWR